MPRVIAPDYAELPGTLAPLVEGIRDGLNHKSRTTGVSNKALARINLKACPACLEVLPRTYEFFAMRKHYFGRSCRRCDRREKRVYDAHYRIEYSKKNPDVQKRANLKSSYGLSLEAWEAMHSAQSGKCAICGRVPPKGLDVDHCHTSGEVRGLLCRRCNRLLGMAMDSPDVLVSAATYLLKFL